MIHEMACIRWACGMRVGGGRLCFKLGNWALLPVDLEDTKWLLLPFPEQIEEHSLKQEVSLNTYLLVMSPPELTAQTSPFP